MIPSGVLPPTVSLDAPRAEDRRRVGCVGEKTDELLTVSVAIECKAWNSPIEKDVIAKFNEVRRDLGLGHAVVVSLNSARPGADTLADELGVIVSGPDEIEPLLGKVSVLGLQNRQMVEEVGFPRLMTTAPSGSAGLVLISTRAPTSGRRSLLCSRPTGTGCTPTSCVKVGAAARTVISDAVNWGMRQGRTG